MDNPSNILIDGRSFGVDWLVIYWYGALIALGILISYLLASHEAKRRNFKKDTVVDICLLVVPLGAIFARLYYVVFEWKSYFNSDLTLGQSLLRVLDFRSGGLAIYGAVLGGIIGLLIYSRVKKAHFLSLCDLIFPGVVLSQAIGRWGNYFNQEAYGARVADWFPKVWPLAVRIDNCTQSCCAELADKTNQIHYATFFYESCWCLLIFIVVWFFVRKRAKHRGDVTLTYLMLYGFERMLVEQLRTDSLMLGGIRISQLVSALLFFGILIFFIVRHFYEKKHNVIIWDNREIYWDGSDAATEKEAPKEEPSDKDDAPAEEPAENEEATAEDAREAADEAAPEEQKGEDTGV